MRTGFLVTSKHMEIAPYLSHRERLSLRESMHSCSPTHTIALRTRRILRVRRRCALIPFRLITICDPVKYGSQRGEAVAYHGADTDKTWERPTILVRPADARSCLSTRPTRTARWRIIRKLKTASW